MSDQPTSGAIVTDPAVTPVSETVHSSPPVSQDTENPATQPSGQPPTASQPLLAIPEETMRFVRKQERDRLYSNLQTLGVPIVKNDKGHRDLKSSLEAYVAAQPSTEGSAATDALPANNGASIVDDLQRRAQQQELETYRQQAQSAQQKMQSLEQELAKISAEREEFVTRTEVNSLLQPVAAPTYFDDAMERFFKEYHIAKGDDGTRYWVGKDNGLIVGTSGKPATTPEVAQQFMQRFPRYAAPTASPGASPSGIPVPGAIIMTAADMAAGKVSAEDLLAGRVVIRG
ncbi:MAG: hypothetical protein JNJ94_06345 [Chlorobi bacterium]|nr:hypothetical protein [Chlorobiota bacterium]